MEDETQGKKRGPMMMIAGVALMLGLGGGGFYAASSGMILAGDKTYDAEDHAVVDPLEQAASAHGEVGKQDVAFVPVEPLVVSVGSSGRARHLRFSAELEVPGPAKDEVQYLMPRIVDAMNGYLRAVDPAEFEDRGALIRLRAQLLRRVELVVGAERVRDVLVMEFVLS